jgi:hypothetical protein
MLARWYNRDELPGHMEQSLQTSNLGPPSVSNIGHVYLKIVQGMTETVRWENCENI